MGRRDRSVTLKDAVNATIMKNINRKRGFDMICGLIKQNPLE